MDRSKKNKIQGTSSNMLSHHPKALTKKRHMKPIKSQHERDKKHKLWFLPDADVFHMIKNKSNRGESGKIEKEIHQDYQKKANSKTGGLGKSC